MLFIGGRKREQNKGEVLHTERDVTDWRQRGRIRGMPFSAKQQLRY